MKLDDPNEYLSLWMSSIFVPVSLSSSAMLEGHTISSKSSLTHKLIGVPQKRLRDTAQSRASRNQLANRFSLTNDGTLNKLNQIAEPLSLNGNLPVRLIVVGKKLGYNLFHADEPRWNGFVE